MSALTLEQAAEELSVHPHTLRRDIADGKLSAMLIRGTYRILRDDFNRYIEVCKAQAIVGRDYEKAQRPIRKPYTHKSKVDPYAKLTSPYL